MPPSTFPFFCTQNQANFSIEGRPSSKEVCYEHNEHRKKSVALLTPGVSSFIKNPETLLLPTGQAEPNIPRMASGPSGHSTSHLESTVEGQKLGESNDPPGELGEASCPS